MVMEYLLRLTRDVLAPGSRVALPPLNRVIYMWHGDGSLDSGGIPASLKSNEAWHGAGPCRVTIGSAGGTVLRYELLPTAAASAASTSLLEHAIPLAPTAFYLMRCDRVDFDPGGEALPHRHKGGGIRCLISGTLELRIEGEPDRTIKPGQAWFESGREAVYAKASSEEPTSFIRCAILPRELRGQSSIMYVDPKHAGSKPRRYTVFVDEPIELGP